MMSMTILSLLACIAVAGITIRVISFTQIEPFLHVFRTEVHYQSASGILVTFNQERFWKPLEKRFTQADIHAAMMVLREKGMALGGMNDHVAGAITKMIEIQPSLEHDGIVLISDFARAFNNETFIVKFLRKNPKIHPKCFIKTAKQLSGKPRRQMIRYLRRDERTSKILHIS